MSPRPAARLRRALRAAVAAAGRPAGGQPRARSPAARSDAAVSEIIGYIMTFFLSSAVLILSMQAFLHSRDTTDNLRAANELRLVADRIAGEVLLASLVATDMPEATYEVAVPLPPLGGRAYTVSMAGDLVTAATADGLVVAESATFSADALGITLSGTVHGAQGSATITYEKSGASKTITLSI